KCIGRSVSLHARGHAKSLIARCVDRPLTLTLSPAAAGERESLCLIPTPAPLSSPDSRTGCCPNSAVSVLICFAGCSELRTEATRLPEPESFAHNQLAIRARHVRWRTIVNEKVNQRMRVPSLEFFESRFDRCHICVVHPQAIDEDMAIPLHVEQDGRV